MKTDDVTTLRRAILQQVVDGVPPAHIARNLQCARSTVYKVIHISQRPEPLFDQRKRNPGRPQLYGDRIWNVIHEYRIKTGLGAFQLYHRLRRETAVYGLQPDDLPSPQRISEYIRDQGLAVKPIGPRDKRIFPDPRPTAPGTLTIDLWGPWPLRATKLYLVTAQDRFERLSLVVPTMSNADGAAIPASDLAGGWARAIIAANRYLEPPGVTLHTIYVDNGIGMVPTNGFLPFGGRTALTIARRLVFIPPAQPWRNGKLERFHLTVQTEYFQKELPSTYAEAVTGLTAYLNYYNLNRPHGSLTYRSPAEYSGHHPVLPEAYWNIPLDRGRGRVVGTVECIRLVNNAGDITLWQTERMHVNELLAGQYVRARFHVTGEHGDGVVVYHPSKGEEVIVASFKHSLDVAGRAPDEPLTTNVRPVEFNITQIPMNQGVEDMQVEKQVARILKRKRRRGDRERADAATEATTGPPGNDG